MAALDFDIYIQSDNTIKVYGLNDGRTPKSYYNAATVTATLYDSRGVVIEGPITCSYVPASNGNYEGNIDDDTVLAERSGYTLVVTAVQGGVKQTFRRSGRGVWG